MVENLQRMVEETLMKNMFLQKVQFLPVFYIICHVNGKKCIYRFNKLKIKSISVDL